ncbi:MAG: diaminopimelate decarboxylase [Burkholderiales bacterium]|jgi:diaminopimelate decarboxylase|nr:diaminopimelate decarboxylase [Burkholderiales bacterium]
MMFAEYKNDSLYIEKVAFADIARQFGTPCYVYSRAALLESAREFMEAFPDALLCYAVKANGNLAVLETFAKLGCGFDIVSGGELARVIAAGGTPSKIVYSGVGKTAEEIECALNAGILCFNVESFSELDLIAAVAEKLKLMAPVSFRVNPDVDPKTHPYISTGLKENKFGIPIEACLDAYRRAAALPYIRVIGIDMHIGSQLTAIAPFADAVQKLLPVIDALNREGISLHHIDLGGGIGVTYRDETVPPLKEWAAAAQRILGNRAERLIVEPGRRMVARAGFLLSRVIHLKPGSPHQFAIVDAAMNDLMRPALYEAWHPVLPVVQHHDVPKTHWNIVGPVCETADFLAKDRALSLKQNDWIAVGVAGAYGSSMSSNYNARPRAAEVMVDGDRAYLIRKRETIESLFANETGLIL